VVWFFEILFCNGMVIVNVLFLFSMLMVFIDLLCMVVNLDIRVRLMFDFL